MNHLQHSHSPYLRQHAGNPVEWHPWSEEALERARREDKPLLVSIGYSTCHWCHVMAGESFQDEEVAAYMNAHFINIKVDREERPDLDQLFMAACQVITGQAGWPLNIFLTPDRRPFYAGTYFPPTPQGKRLSWSQALQYAAYNFYENRRAVDRQADRVLDRLQQSEDRVVQLELTGPERESFFDEAWAETLFEELQPQFDREAGGFGRAPKFPNTLALALLMQYGWYTGNEAAERHWNLSLLRMLDGGIYDHLGGGLARYAVDRYWQVPHFEKMLYDNALLVGLLADACRRTEGARYREALEETIGFIERELTRQEGGFYAALDADTEGREGAYYTWDKKEVKKVLGEKADLFCDFYGVTEEGNWEGTNILRRSKTIASFAEENGMTAEDAGAQLKEARQRLFEVRRRRPRPHRDEQVLLSWNALMVSAYVKACHALGREAYARRARRHLKFLLGHFQEEETGAVRRSLGTGQPAFLEDYALLIEALLESYTLDYDTTLLRRAEVLTEQVLHLFSDEEQLLFYFTAESAEVPMRRRQLLDDELPSGNAVMAGNLSRLGVLLDRPEWRGRAHQMLLSMRNSATQDPLGYGRWGSEMLAAVYGYIEVAVVGPNSSLIAEQIHQRFLPHYLLMAAPDAKEHFPLLRDRTVREKTLIYLCRDYVCHRPVESVEELWEAI